MPEPPHEPAGRAAGDDATQEMTGAGAAAAAGSGLGRWGRLCLLEKLGAGGNGEVFRAWDELLERQVALKLRRPELSGGPAEAARVIHEGRLLARIEHPHVARVYGVDEHDGRVGLWMELVQGTDLRTLVIERGPVSARDAALVGLDLCSALAAVHGADVVHGDVKPQNVIREQGGRIVLVDFGAGSPRQAAAGDGGAISGTPLYMAPELLRGQRASPSSDLYGLGVLLWHLVTGEYPVPGRSLAEIAAAHARGERRHLRDVRPDLPAGFVRVVERACHPDPQERFASAGELEAALYSVLDLQAAPTAASPPRRRGRPRWLSLAAGLLALVAVGLVWRGPWRAGPDAAGALSATAVFSAVSDRGGRELSPGDQVGPRDRLGLSLEVNRPAFVYVLNTDQSGRTVVMFPIAGGAQPNPLAPGKRHWLPEGAGGGRLGWTLSADRGVERFLVVASAERLGQFEAELQALPVVDAGGGLTVRPATEVAIAALTRGVTGVARIPATAGAQASPVDFLVGLAGRRGSLPPGANQVWVHELRLVNAGL